MEGMPRWMENLDSEDMEFVRKFLLASGSLKKIAKEYDVTYPTVRLRLDRLIGKITMTENQKTEPYINLIKRLALNEQIDFNTAKVLIEEYRKTKDEEDF